MDALTDIVVDPVVDPLTDPVVHCVWLITPVTEGD